MSIAGGIVVFVLSWWIAFFAVLPIGVRSQWEGDTTVPGTDEGAPQDPMLVKKAIWATIGAAVLTLIASFIVPRLLAG